MRIALQILVMLIVFGILWEKPQFLIELGKTNEGILLLIALLALSVYLSPITGVLVGTVIIFLIKEGCDCSVNVAKSIEYQIAEMNVQDNNKKNTINSIKTKKRVPILTASVLEKHDEDIVEFDEMNLNKYPSLPENSYDNVSVFTNDSTDLLHKSERLKPMCSRVY